MNVVATGLPASSSATSSYTATPHPITAPPPRRATRYLPLAHVRVDHRAAVLAHDVAQELDLARLDVDLTRAQVRRVDPDVARLRGVPRAGFEPGRHAGRQRVRVEVREP